VVGWYIAVFLVGLAIGSFLNVCIYRIPRNLSIKSPRRSFCPSCNQPIKAYDNIPIVSYLILRGRCRQCGNKISIRYPIIELLTALAFVTILNRCEVICETSFATPNMFNISLYFLSAIIFVSLLIAISAIDIDFYIIPNSLVFTGLIVGFLLAIATSIAERNTSYLTDRVFGAILGTAMIGFIALIGSLVFHKQAMGMGDVKLMGMIGMFLGAFPHLLIVLISSAFIGSIAGILLILLIKPKFGSRSKIPYGPFLSIGAVLSLLYGELAWNLYRRLY